jgi:hypothetical protein
MLWDDKAGTPDQYGIEREGRGVKEETFHKRFSI